MWMQSKAWVVECAVPSPLAGHAVNPSMGTVGSIHAANGPASGEDTALDSRLAADEGSALPRTGSYTCRWGFCCGLIGHDIRQASRRKRMSQYAIRFIEPHNALLVPRTPTSSTGSCPPTVGGIGAAQELPWMASRRVSR
ncbi:hypothetical protein XANMN_14370 [Xanthomonas phaseoli pv. manihotis str. CIO151]|nr:hypothetical protein XANMN_14370 [Xanthomonas phaseoli pv. manihotis str. CIO151]